MDNLTHSLVGAALGQAGLKRKTALAMPTLIIGANLPDIDAFATLLGTQSLALRRGVTHGPIALLLLPLLLTAAMLAYDRWRTRRSLRQATEWAAQRGARPPVHAGWLLLLAYVGTLSHPVLDWLNVYGIRLLEPFSSTWFAANTLFIIDLWVWIALGLSVFLSLRKERRGHSAWRTPALLGLSSVLVYIAANGLITQRAETITRVRVPQELGRTPTLVVANPVPVAFWQREMLWRDVCEHGTGRYSLFGGAGRELMLEAHVRRHHMDDPRVQALANTDAHARAFLFWSRMPTATIEGNTVTLGDQRFTRAVTLGTFTVRAQLPDAAAPAAPRSSP